MVALTRTLLLAALTLVSAGLISCGQESRTLDPINGPGQPILPPGPDNPHSPDASQWRQVPGARVLCERENHQEIWLITESNARFSALRIEGGRKGFSSVQLNELEALAKLIPSQLPIRQVSSMAVSHSGTALARETLAKTSYVDGKRLRIYYWDLVMTFAADGTGTLTLEKYSKDSLGYPYSDLRTDLLVRFLKCIWN